MMLDLRWRDCRFDFRLGHYQVIATWTGGLSVESQPFRYMTNIEFHPVCLAGVKVRHVHLCQVAANTV